MIKIGFIDYYLDEWHANNYPRLIKEISGGRYEVCYAYGKIDSPIGGITNREWAEKNNVELVGSIEGLVEKSERIIVLSPDNPEMHEELCELPLKSGKLVYIDKTFAPDRKTAERIFALADKYNTKCYSSSALRFSSELASIDKNSVYRLYSEGPGTYEMYSIHQLEPIVSIMGKRAKRVVFTGEENHPAMIIEFEDGRCAQMYQTNGSPFRITVDKEDNESDIYLIKSDYFGLFLKELVRFFDTGEIIVPHKQTIDVIAIREAGLKAMKKPYTWINV